MIFGTPDIFAIWYDSVEPWSTERFDNGCFGYIVNGKLMWSMNSTLSIDLYDMENLYCMNNSVRNDTFFQLPAKKLITELQKLSFPTMDSNVEKSDFTYFLSPQSLSDEGHDFFIVENGDLARIIYSNKDDESSILEITMDVGKFQSIARNAIASYRTR
ncbi:Imm42 family immunity protein [Ralstonia sp. ASV6]|uniref:Imm42 family immunity protein n=1 Tax=Ralstonia sp. ASV6 TaxID=2795124 RepID=UPI0018EC8775|nr:Imm42 family immunity protein [Ralstonia sp. ASV6]